MSPRADSAFVLASSTSSVDGARGASGNEIFAVAIDGPPGSGGHAPFGAGAAGFGGAAGGFAMQRGSALGDASRAGAGTPASMATVAVSGRALAGAKVAVATGAALWGGGALGSGGVREHPATAMAATRNVRQSIERASSATYERDATKVSGTT